MKWALLELNKYKDSPLKFKEELNLTESLIKREEMILDVAPIKVTGELRVTDYDYVVDFNVETILTLPSTRSLEPVEVPLEFMVTEIYMTPEQFTIRKEFLLDEEMIMVLDKDLIDLSEAIEDHILLSIPLQVLTPAEKQSHQSIKGEAWELMSEEAFLTRQTQQEETNIDPRLAKLATLLDNNKDSDNE